MENFCKVISKTLSTPISGGSDRRLTDLVEVSETRTRMFFLTAIVVTTALWGHFDSIADVTIGLLAFTVVTFVIAIGAGIIPTQTFPKGDGPDD